MDIIEMSCKEFESILRNGFYECPLCHTMGLKHADEHVFVMYKDNPEWFNSVHDMNMGMTGGAGPAAFVPAVFYMHNGMGIDTPFQLVLCACTYCKKVFGIYCNRIKEQNIERRKRDIAEARNEKNNKLLYKDWDNEDNKRLNVICNQVGIHTNLKE